MTTTPNVEQQKNWIIAQAEEGRLSGARESRLLAGYSGSGYVTHFEQPDDHVEVDFTIDNSGSYVLYMRYALPLKEQRNHLYVDGIHYGDMVNARSATFTTAELCTVHLEAGVHRVKLAKSGGGIMVDYFALAPLAQRQPLPFSLSNPQASPEARTVMRYLAGIHGQRMLTGQHTVAAAGPELAFIEEKTGKLPALRGFDLMSYSHYTETELPTEHKRWEIEVNAGSIEAAIDWYNNRGGLVTFCWHWYSPLGGEDKTFYTWHTNFDLTRALIEGTPEHEALLADMDAGAAALQKLQDANVPVLWRPLHEADGGWFWWGAKGAEPYKKLWRLMYDRYTNHHGLHNLIWVWNAPNPDWYPGGDVIDLSGADIYNAKGNHGPLTFWHDYTSLMTGHSKPVALTENGPILDPDLVIKTRTPWLWNMVWGGGFVTEGISTSFEMLHKVYNHSYCITLDQLPDWTSYDA
jgi:mannan endo-1,4-beta-mannosidase